MTAAAPKRMSLPSSPRATLASSTSLSAAERKRRDESGIRQLRVREQAFIDPEPTLVDFGDLDIEPFDDAPATERNPSPPDGCEGRATLTKVAAYSSPPPRPQPTLASTRRSAPSLPKPTLPSAPPLHAPAAQAHVLPASAPMPASDLPVTALVPSLPAVVYDYDSSADPVILPISAPFAWAHRWSERALELVLAFGGLVEGVLARRAAKRIAP